MYKITLLLFIAFAPLHCAHAEIYKCVENGETTYQGEPCAVPKPAPRAKVAAQPKESQARNSAPKSKSSIFDGWEFGSTIDQVKQVARLRQLPMSPGTSSFLSGYNEKVLNRAPTSRVYTYKTKLFDKYTNVTLFFTKTSRRLYKIEASFSIIQLKPEERKYFYESIYTSLSKKYGKAKNIDIPRNTDHQGVLFSLSHAIAGQLMKGMVGSLLIWEINDDATVTMNYKERYQHLHSVKLTYTSVGLEKANETEVTQDIQRNTNKAISRDYDKL